MSKYIKHDDGNIHNNDLDNLSVYKSLTSMGITINEHIAALKTLTNERKHQFYQKPLLVNQEQQMKRLSHAKKQDKKIIENYLRTIKELSTGTKELYALQESLTKAGCNGINFLKEIDKASKLHHKKSLNLTAINKIYNVITALNMPMPAQEYKGIPNRKYRFDFAWPNIKLAIEYEGGAYQKEGHRMSTNFVSDCEKYSLAAIHGWTVIRITVKQLDDGKLKQWLKLYLKQELNMETKDIIKKVRLKLDFNQEQLANLVGLSQPAVSLWVNGKTKPDIRSCVIMANACNGDPSLIEILESVSGETIKIDSI